MVRYLSLTEQYQLVALAGLHLHTVNQKIDWGEMGTDSGMHLQTVKDDLANIKIHA